MEIVFEEPSGALTSIHVDATIREAHTTSSQVTEHPVEQGANISDHVRPDLEKLTLEVFITNTPITVPKSHLGSVQGEVRGAPLPARVVQRREGGPRLTNAGMPPQRLLLGLATPGVAPSWEASPLVETNVSGPTASVLQFSAKFDRVRTVYDELRRLVTGGVLCRILTGLREYENMVLKNMDTPRENAQGNAIVVTLDAIQVRLVKTEVVELPKVVRARTKKNKGPQPATAEAAPKPQAKASIASYLTGLGTVVPTQ